MTKATSLRLCSFSARGNEASLVSLLPQLAVKLCTEFAGEVKAFLQLLEIIL